MQWFPAGYANLATVNQTVTNITVTTRRARVRAVTRAPDKRDMRANCASDETPSDAAPLVN